MGMEQRVTFGPGAVPPWETVRDLLAARGYPVQTRMIDGQLAFPDEAPPPEWNELRIGTPQGMVTVRRQPGALTFVTWGNADAALRQAWNAVVWAFAEAGAGQVQTDHGAVSAADYRRTAELPGPLRG
jgi:hypothetical protein